MIVPINRNSDEYWLSHALSLAEHAAEQGEVPVGAVLTLNDELIAEGYNQPIAKNDPTAHAEIIALRQGAEKIGNYRLTDTTLYVTLEPCIMCASAMVHARIKRLVYGAYDPRAGAIVSKMQILDQSFLNHRIIQEGGLMKEACGDLLRQFFAKKR